MYDFFKENKFINFYSIYSISFNNNFFSYFIFKIKQTRVSKKAPPVLFSFNIKNTYKNIKKNLIYIFKVSLK